MGIATVVLHSWILKTDWQQLKRQQKASVLNLSEFWEVFSPQVYLI